MDVEHYVFRVELSDSSSEVRGDARVDVRVVLDGVAELALDFANGMTVDGVSEHGAGVAYVHTADRLRLALKPLGKAGERRSVTVRYHGTPAGGLRIGPNAYGKRMFWTLHWPNLARQWLPVIDHPYDKATSEFVVTAPAKYQVVANGGLVETEDLGDGRRRTHWKESVPIPSWLNAIAAGEFSVRHFGSYRGVELSNWVYLQDREKGTAMFDTATRDAIAFFSEFVAPYPYEKLASVQVPGFQGGMEHASVIFYGEKWPAPERAAGLVAHEIAHQWFGNSVTERDWDDVWLSEGFATYFSMLCAEHVSGRDAFVLRLQQSRTVLLSATDKLPGVDVVHDGLADMKLVINDLVYQKGAWTLHMLRGLIGMDAFRAGVREYYARYRNGNATTADFQRIMETNGDRPLGWFFNQWLRRPGVPEVKGSWNFDGKAVKVVLRQAGELYRLPMEIAIDGRVEKIELNEREQTFSFPAEKAPAAVTLDPNLWVLMKSEFH